MNRAFVILILALLAWYGYSQYQSQRTTNAPLATISEPTQPVAPPIAQSNTAPSSQFKCDGRTHCSQMTSCAEATYFLKNCPGTKMDGNNDGIPCEKQWCK